MRTLISAVTNRLPFLCPIKWRRNREWELLAPDLATAIDIVPVRVIDYERETVIPKAAFNETLFTKRELRLMRELAAKFHDELTKPLISLTHNERGPWEKVWDDGKGNNERIPYSLAIPDDDPSRASILEAAREYEGLLAANPERRR